MFAGGRCCAIVAAVLVASAPAVARGDVRGVFRIGVEPIGLEPSSDTPYVGSHVADAITAYNAAVTAYNRAHGYAAGSAMASQTIDASALALHATLVTLAPGLEAGGEHIRFRVEGLVGISDHVRAYGIGLYPLDLVLPLSYGAVTPYLAAGGTLRWLDRSDTDGDSGGLFTVRIAGGARIGRHIAVELGVSAYMIGGTYNSAELRSMSSYNPRSNTPPPPADRVVSGGTQSGMIDIAVGFVL